MLAGMEIVDKMPADNKRVAARTREPECNKPAACKQAAVCKPAAECNKPALLEAHIPGPAAYKPGAVYTPRAADYRPLAVGNMWAAPHPLQW